jgi:outer membrane lipoprotein carrier protein
MTLAILLSVLSAASPAAGVAPGPASAEQILEAVGRRHRDVRDLEARFVQTYRSGALEKEIVESGTLRLKRPGRMRWDYRSPERKLFVSDGTHVYFYVPSDHQVVVRKQGGDQTLAFRLLSGESDLTREFSPKLLPGLGGQLRLQLKPRTPDPDVDSVVLDVGPQYRIDGIEIHDLQGNESRFRFESIRENRGLSDRLFHFEVPADAEVVQG